MQLIKSSLSFLIVIIVTFQSFSQDADAVQNPELTEFGQKIFNCLKNEDTSSFSLLVAKKEEILEAFQNQITDEEFQKKAVEALRSGWKSIDKKYSEKSKKDFKVILELGRKRGFKWKKIKFDHFDAHILNKIPGISTISGRLYFKHKKKSYYIYVRDVFRLKDQWKIMELRATDIVEIKE